MREEVIVVDDTVVLDRDRARAATYGIDNEAVPVELSSLQRYEEGTFTCFP
ncbi:MAG: hypothetical protein M1339_04825 [Bacteroidetes bacterium]|nr:hypothetical protein [Bacteroidota bacterium]